MENDKFFIKKIEEEVSKCIRCGACRDVCPVFISENTEVTSPRGKNSLLIHLISEDLTSKDLNKLLNSCTLCEACLDACPKDIPTFNNVLYGRIITENNKKLNKIINKPFSSNAIMNAGSKLLSLLQDTLFIKDGDIFRLKWRIGDISEKTLPEVPNKSFFRLYQPFKDKQEQYDNKVLFFVGCLIRYLYPQTGIHLIEILNHFNWGVIVPEEQGCCGLPAVSSGDLDDFRDSMDNNLSVFSSFDNINHIISACGSCGNTLQNYYVKFSEQSSFSKPDIENFTKKVIDFTDFLINVIKFDEKWFDKTDISVTYHDSCHLNRGMGTTEAPRKLLEITSNYTEMNEASACCGFGGSFSIKEFDSSQKILSRKIENVKETGANYLTAGCPGCVLQLTEGVSKFSSNEQQVVHIVDYLYNLIFK